mmetsp:Transcript_29486/g.40518  ORF Transcript_29486/g.40518 Transcript_29486/m.40518 type:complete len:118 (-) Transcript_29486:1508-1861(-)
MLQQLHTLQYGLAYFYPSQPLPFSYALPFNICLFRTLSRNSFLRVIRNQNSHTNTINTMIPTNTPTDTPVINFVEVKLQIDDESSLAAALALTVPLLGIMVGSELTVGSSVGTSVDM